MKADRPKLIWERLAAEGLIAGEAPGRIEQPPWYVRVMLGFAGWLGALFLFGFVGMALTPLVQSGGGATFMGLVLCGGAAFLFQLKRGGEFSSQFGLAVSFAGQALVVFGLMELAGGQKTVGYLLASGFESAVALILANAANRFVATIAAVVLFGIALSVQGMELLVPALVTAAFAFLWLNEMAWARRGSLVRPVAYGLVIAAVGFDLTGLFSEYGAWVGHGAASAVGVADYWAGLLVKGAALVFVAWRLLVREGARMGEWRVTAVLLVMVLVAGGLYKAPGIVTALAVVLLGFANGNRLLTGVGIFAATLYLGVFYYQLEATLLEKAGALVSTGLLLLVARVGFLRLWPALAADGGKNA